MSDLRTRRALGDELSPEMRARRPVHTVRISFVDLGHVGALPPAPAGRVVPIEAAIEGDEQVFCARAIGATNEPIIDLDRLASLSTVRSVVASTEVRARVPLPSITELLLVNVLPVRAPDAETLRNLPNLAVFWAVRATGERRLDTLAIAQSLASIGVGRQLLAAHGQRDALSSLTAFSRLENVVVTGCHPTDSVAPLAGTQSLRSIWSDAPGGWPRLGRLTSLESLAAEDARITSLRAMTGWTSLRSLWLSGGSLQRLDGIERMTALASLDLRFLRVDDLSPLSELPELATLRLVCLSRLREVDAVATLPSLRELEISGAYERQRRMRVTTLQPLRVATSLELLRVRHTAIDDADLSPLTELPRLRRVELPSELIDAARLLRVARPDIRVDIEEASDRPAPGDTELGGVVVHSPLENDERWWILEDLAPLLSTETNAAAEDVLRRALRAEDPALEKRLEFDTEAGAVGIRMPSKQDALAVARVIGRLRGPG